MQRSPPTYFQIWARGAFPHLTPPHWKLEQNQSWTWVSEMRETHADPIHRVTWHEFFICGKHRGLCQNQAEWHRRRCILEVHAAHQRRVIAGVDLKGTFLRVALRISSRTVGGSVILHCHRTCLAPPKLRTSTEAMHIYRKYYNFHAGDKAKALLIVSNSVIVWVKMSKKCQLINLFHFRIFLLSKVRCYEIMKSFSNLYLFLIIFSHMIQNFWGSK